MLRAIAHDLTDALPEPGRQAVDPPGTAVIEEIALLVEDYSDIQDKQIRDARRQPRRGAIPATRLEPA